MKQSFYLLCLLFSSVLTVSSQVKWPDPQPEARPYTRWWWLGSAVNEKDLRYNLTEYARAGIGGVEITPIYGVQGNEANNIDYLSPEWMQMLGKVQQISAELNLEVNMSTGTGWPFGGPWVPLEEAAAKLKVEDGQLLTDHTRQKVKRAAPGGDGFVVDHFDRQSVLNYLSRFDRAFAQSGVPYPHTFFNDSYEVYNADWTPRLLEEFSKRRGYALEDHVAEFLGQDGTDKDLQQRIISDYRETLSDLLLENFTTVWTDWAHSHGAITRNQAHGSPANLIDIYAQVDIPECEGFGLSDFGIKGLRTDKGFTKTNDSDISMLKYASSGAHISGKQFTSSETFTWLTEHFRTSFSQCKPDFDLMMVAGVNHVFFHGSCYTPEDDAWPGWKFYATVDMSPTNSLWRDAPAFFKYIERTQTFMQMGEPDNDVLVYLPFHDMIYEQSGRLLQFDIHSMARKAPRFIASIGEILHAGYDCDYISDRYLMQARPVDGLITTTGRNRYAAIVVPGVRFMPLESMFQLFLLARQGAKVIFVGDMPQSAPGLMGLSLQEQFEMSRADLKECAIVTDDYSVLSRFVAPETMRTHQGLSMIRRRMGNEYIYFISNLQSRDVDEWVTLGKKGTYATFYNPMNGDITRAKLRQTEQQTTELRLQLRSGESIIVVLSDKDNAEVEAHRYLREQTSQAITLSGWTLRFAQAAPQEIKKTYKMNEPKSWTLLGDEALQTTMATGVYSTSFRLPPSFTTDRRIILDLGDVRETARIRLNGHDIATLFAVPYRLDITPYIKKGNNKLEVEVTNLAANRISKMDRDGIKWRKFEEINVVDLNYKTTLYDQWQPMPSGLCSPVRIIPAIED